MKHILNYKREIIKCETCNKNIITYPFTINGKDYCRDCFDTSKLSMTDKDYNEWLNNWRQ